MRPPLLSAFDPLAEGEGSIDPLGLAPFYERLADRMLPAVTVRMGRPRFVTAMAVGAYLSQKLPVDAVAADGVTPPWLVFEWFVVEAFVRERQLLEPGSRIPGVLKAQLALRNRRPISAHTYLKTPTVFGFTGIFRRLARTLQIITQDGRLDDNGYELLSAWAKEQNMDGFVDGDVGAGATFRKQLLRAISQGMDKGHTIEQTGEFWKSIVRTLDPAKLKGAERQVLLRLLLDRAGPSRMVRSISDALMKRKSTIELAGEGEFLRELSKRVDPDFRTLLLGIDAYERLCGVLADSFDWILFVGGTFKGAPIGREEYRGRHIDALSASMQAAIGAVESHPCLIEWEPGLITLLDRFRGVKSVGQMYLALLLHHEAVQKAKPPDGKRPWFERGRADRVLVRPDYVLQAAPIQRTSHVHEYRVPTFSRFLSDLGAFA